MYVNLFWNKHFSPCAYPKQLLNHKKILLNS